MEYYMKRICISRVKLKTKEIYMKLKCLLFGHKKYSPNILQGHSLFSLKDALGSDLVNIDVCERCGAVFSDLFLTTHNSSYETPQSKIASSKSAKADFS